MFYTVFFAFAYSVIDCYFDSNPTTKISKFIIAIITMLIMLFKLSSIGNLIYHFHFKFIFKYFLNNTINSLDENFIKNRFENFIYNLKKGNLYSNNKLPFYLGCDDGLVSKKYLGSIIELKGKNKNKGNMIRKKLKKSKLNSIKTFFVKSKFLNYIKIYMLVLLAKLKILNVIKYLLLNIKKKKDDKFISELIELGINKDIYFHISENIFESKIIKTMKFENNYSNFIDYLKYNESEEIYKYFSRTHYSAEWEESELYTEKFELSIKKYWSKFLYNTEFDMNNEKNPFKNYSKDFDILTTNKLNVNIRVKWIMVGNSLFYFLTEYKLNYIEIPDFVILYIILCVIIQKQIKKKYQM